MRCGPAGGCSRIPERPSHGRGARLITGEAAEAGAEADGAVDGQAAAEPTVTEPPVDDDLERLLAEEEEIERRTREQHHEAPHFRKESD